MTKEAKKKKKTDYYSLKNAAPFFEKRTSKISSNSLYLEKWEESLLFVWSCEWKKKIILWEIKTSSLYLLQKYNINAGQKSESKKLLSKSKRFCTNRGKYKIVHFHKQKYRGLYPSPHSKTNAFWRWAHPQTHRR